MIYERLTGPLLSLLKAPAGPPAPPAGSRGSVRTFRAAPNFLTYQMLLWGAGFAAGIVGELLYIFAERGAAESGWAELSVGYGLLVLTLAGSVCKFFLIRLEYDMRYYVVTDRSLRIREGVVVIHESTFTFANVQNLRINQGPVERLLGLSNLVVETAGGSGKGSREEGGGHPFRRGHEGRLRGVANAREIRDQILELLRRYRDAGLGDPEERGRAGPRRGGGGLPPEALERLREIRAELRLLGGASGTLPAS